MSELVDGVDELLDEVDTISEGVESESLTWEPGRKTTVLAHNDFAVDGPGVPLISGGGGGVGGGGGGRGWGGGGREKVLDHQRVWIQ